MDINDVMRLMLDAFPNATIGEDEDGQLIIHTNLTVINSDEEVMDMDDLPMRPLHVIAKDIRAHWPKVNYAAEPYLKAMTDLSAVTDNYYLDSSDSIIRYFLANANGWRGPDARRIKAELRGMLK